VNRILVNELTEWSERYGYLFTFPPYPFWASASSGSGISYSEIDEKGKWKMNIIERPSTAEVESGLFHEIKLSH